MSDPSTILDMSVIETLQALQRPGAPSILERITAAFKRSGTTLLEELRHGADNGDLQAVRNAAHSLKSGSANVGAIAFSQTACTIEFAARDGDTAATTDAVLALEGQWAALIDALDGILKSDDLSKSA